MGKQFRIGRDYQEWIPEGATADPKAVQAWDPVAQATLRVSELCARWRIISIRCTSLDLEWKRWWQKAFERIESRIKTYCLTFGLEPPNFVTMAGEAASKSRRAEAVKLDRTQWTESYAASIMELQQELVVVADEALKDHGTPELRRASNQLMHQLNQELFHVQALEKDIERS